MAVIAVSGLQKRYGSLQAVAGLDLTVEAGQIFGMLGPNGAGKTTTVEILVGLRPRDGGEVRVFGLDPERKGAEIKQRIGVQLQAYGLYPRLKVREVVELFASFYTRSLPAEEVLARVNLAEKAQSLVKTLSGGQAQRLALALAMVNDAELLFLDEPTTGLDPQARRSLWEVILALKRQGKTVFLTTHYMDEAERLCDTVAIVDHGKVIALGSPAELIQAAFQEQAIEFAVPALADGLNWEELESLPGVARGQSDGEKVTLYTAEVSRVIAALLAWTQAKGIAVDDMVVRRATLEDVFLKLTGRRIRE